MGINNIVIMVREFNGKTYRCEYFTDNKKHSERHFTPYEIQVILMVFGCNHIEPDGSDY